MDVLSDVIAVMRAGAPVAARTRWYGPFGQRFASAPGAAGFRVVTEGACWLIPEIGPPLALRTGDIVFLPHERGHALADHLSTPLLGLPCDRATPIPELATMTTSGDERSPGSATVTAMVCGAYELDPARVHPLLADLPEVVHIGSGATEHSRILAAVALLDHELERPRPGTDAVIAGLLDTLLLYILRTWLDRQLTDGQYTDGQPRDAGPTIGLSTDAGPVNGGWAMALRDPAISTALRDIHADPGRPWTVAALGQRAGLSRAAFSQRFHALVGQPPLTYLTWWRMTLAARMLRESDLPNGAVAHRLGYASEFSFGKAFKRHHGSSPGSFRSGRAGSRRR